VRTCVRYDAAMESALQLRRELPDELTALAEHVAPLVLARERTLPVSEMFAELFPERGLVRGHTLACTGPAATSLALALAAPAVAAGSWLAAIDVPTIGLDAANEFGIPLERVVAVNTQGRSGTSAPGVECVSTGVRPQLTHTARWPDVVAAAADGFDLLITRVPVDVSPSAMRKVATRLRQRDVVMLVLGDPGALSCDGVLDAGDARWVGLGDGHGHLRQRRLVVEASGRRLHGRRRCHLALPG
jgi:hypothetical protein